MSEETIHYKSIT